MSDRDRVLEILARTEKALDDEHGEATSVGDGVDNLDTIAAGLRALRAVLKQAGLA